MVHILAYISNNNYIIGNKVHEKYTKGAKKNQMTERIDKKEHMDFCNYLTTVNEKYKSLKKFELSDYQKPEDPDHVGGPQAFRSDSGSKYTTVQMPSNVKRSLEFKFDDTDEKKVDMSHMKSCKEPPMLQKPLTKSPCKMYSSPK